MPKIEAANHRHRQRYPQRARLPTPRFPVLHAARLTYEYDRLDSLLRISWSGGQQFVSYGDAKQLYGFLRRIYEPQERKTRSARPLRR